MKIIIAGINQRDELALKVTGLRGAWFLFLYIEYTSLSKCIPALGSRMIFTVREPGTQQVHPSHPSKGIIFRRPRANYPRKISNKKRIATALT